MVSKGSFATEDWDSNSDVRCSLFLNLNAWKVMYMYRILDIPKNLMYSTRMCQGVYLSP